MAIPGTHILDALYSIKASVSHYMLEGYASLTTLPVYITESSVTKVTTPYYTRLLHKHHYRISNCEILM